MSMGVGLALSLTVRNRQTGGSGGGLQTFAYQAETTALANSYAVAPTKRRKDTMDWAIRTLKTAGVWSKLKQLVMVGDTTDASYRDWKTTNALTVVGTPTFVANTYVAGATNARVRTGLYLDDFDPADCSFGMMAHSGSGSSSSDIGAQNASSQGISMTPRTASNVASARLCSLVSTAYGQAGDFGGGANFTAFSRSDLINIYPFRGSGVNKGANPVAGVTGLGHIEIMALANNANGTFSNSTRPISGWFFATALTDAEMKVLSNVMTEVKYAYQYGELDATDPGYLPASATYDVVVYGATSPGLTAAYEAKRQGLSVCIVGGWRDRHIGGMSSGGLGNTDFNTKASLAGLPRWILTQVQAIEGSGATSFTFEPRHFEYVARGMLDPRITGGLDIPVFWSDGLPSVSGKSVTISGRTFTWGSYAVEASYEGDLVFAAACAVTYGREAAGSGVEAANGYRGNTTAQSGSNHQFKKHDTTLVNIDPWITPGTPASGLLPSVNGLMSAQPAAGAADSKLQAYNFRLTTTTALPDIVPLPATPPPGYSALNYEALGRVLAADPTLVFTDLVILGNVNGSVSDVNSKWGLSTDLWGGATGYLQQTAAQREVTWKRHENWARGLYYYLQYEADARIPVAVRNACLTQGWSNLHYCRPHPNDDYNWPYQLYVREGYRLVGDYVHTGNDIVAVDGTTPRSIKTIAVASYQMDSHSNQALAEDLGGGNWRIWNEGGFEDLTNGGVDKTSPLPYEIILPSRATRTDMFSVFPVSATHVAFGSDRMEFTAMLLGQAAAVAAAVGKAAGNVAVQDIDYTALRTALLATPTLSGETAPLLPQVN
jgi:hypothetical protein